MRDTIKDHTPDIMSDFLQSVGDLSTMVDLFNCLPDVYFFIKDINSHFIAANNLQLNKLGLRTLEEIVGKSDYDFFPSYMVAGYHMDDKRVMKTGIPIKDRVELVANPDGSIDWHTTSKFPLYNNVSECIGISGIMRDLNRSSDIWSPHQQMNEVMEHINDHYQEHLEIGALAKIANLSISQFERRFRKVFGQTPNQFIIRYRLTRASQILAHTNLTLTSIAHEVGFFDHSHFSREFKKLFGSSPGKYRKEHMI